MSNFNQHSEEEKIFFLKDEYVRVLEEVINKNNAEILKLLPQDQTKEIVEYANSLKPEACTCEEGCLDMDKVEGVRVPKELSCLIEIARTRCENTTY